MLSLLELNCSWFSIHLSDRYPLTFWLMRHLYSNFLCVSARDLSNLLSKQQLKSPPSTVKEHLYSSSSAATFVQNEEGGELGAYMFIIVTHVPWIVSWIRPYLPSGSFLHVLSTNGVVLCIKIETTLLLEENDYLPNGALVSYALHPISVFLVERLLFFMRKVNIFFRLIGWWIPFTL